MAIKVKVNDDKAQRDYGAKVDLESYKRTKQQYKNMTFMIDMKWKKASSEAGNKKTQEISGRVLASFGLQCFKKALKNKDMILSQQE